MCFLQLFFDISNPFCRHNESIEWYFLTPMYFMLVFKHFIVWRFLIWVGLEIEIEFVYYQSYNWCKSLQYSHCIVFVCKSLQHFWCTFLFAQDKEPCAWQITWMLIMLYVFIVKVECNNWMAFLQDENVMNFVRGVVTRAVALHT